MRRNIILFIVITTLLVCIGITKVSMAESLKGSKLTLLIQATVYRATGGEKGIVAKFSKETGAEVTVITQASATEIYEKAAMEWMAGTGRYDVITINSPNTHEGIIPYIEPLDKYLGSASADYDFNDIIPSLIDPLRFGGVLYAIPLRFGGGFFYYRKDLFQKYGLQVPKTMDELLKVGKRLTLDIDGDGKIDIYGLVQRAKEPHTSVDDFQRFLYAFGGRIFSEDKKKCFLNTPEGIATEEFFVKLLKEGILPPDFTAFGRDEQIVSFQQGRAAMTIAFAPYYDYFIDPKKSKVWNSVGWALPPTKSPVPLGRTNFSTWNLIIDKNSRNKKAAWALVEALTSKENQFEMALKYANGPVRNSTFLAPEYLKMYPLSKDWLAAAAVSLFESHPKWSEIESIIHEEHSAALLGKKTPKEAIETMEKRIQPLL